MEITNEIFEMLVNLYNELDIGLFKKKDKIDRKKFCEILGISEYNNITYKKIINILKEKECIKIHNWVGKKIYIEIDSEKLDRIIRETELFNKIKDFIFKSTNGVAEIGV